MSASVWNPNGQQQVPALPAVAPVSFIKNLVSNPGINFVGDTDTGIWSESDGYLNLVSNGITVLRIDPQGNIQGNKFASGVELTIGSAAVTDIGSLATNSVQVTGASTITSFGTNYKGPMFVRFASALTLTHNATTLICPGAANISVVAGDSCVVTPKATAGTPDGWVVVSYQAAAPLLNAVTSINGGQLRGLGNRLINGGMQVAQRGNQVFTTTASLYGGCDRFLTTVSGTTVSAIALQALPGTIYTSTGYAHQVGNVTTTGATSVQISQRIEALNSASLVGKTVTFSGKVLQVTGSSQTLTIGYTRANASDTFTTQTALASTTQVILNNSWTPVSFTTTLSDSNVVNGLMVYLAFSSLGAQSNTQFYFGDMQLEVGSVATPFEQRPYGMELSLCQRYLPVTAAFSVLAGQCISTTQGYIAAQFPVQARVTPTGITTAATTGVVWNAAGSSIATTNWTFGSNTGNTSGMLIPTVAAGLVVGNGLTGRCNSDILWIGCEL